MSALGGRLDGLRVLDLFAGSGALGLEALSRGAAHATFVEIARDALRAVDENIETLGAGSRCTVVRGDALRYLEAGTRGAVDLALADPPYDRDFVRRLVERFRCHPFAEELWVEHRTGEVLPDVPGMKHRRYGDTTLTSLQAGSV